METLEYFRIFNIFVAGLALVLNLMKGYYLKLHKIMGIDSQMGFLALMAWPLAYGVAATVAAFNDVAVGLWTIIMSVPIMWTLVAGLMGWPSRETNLEQGRRKAAELGLISLEELRDIGRKE